MAFFFKFKQLHGTVSDYVSIWMYYVYIDLSLLSVAELYLNIFKKLFYTMDIIINLLSLFCFTHFFNDQTFQTKKIQENEIWLEWTRFREFFKENLKSFND